MKHEGSLDDLQTIIRGCGFDIESVDEQEHCYQIRTKEGAICNWYRSTGTIQFQGKKEPKEKLLKAWGQYTGSDSSSSPSEEVSQGSDTPVAPIAPIMAHKKVFVVHGHDSNSKEQLELILHKLGLYPFVLANTGGGGLTIIEALEKEIGPDPKQARFGIVLLTPDDVGYAYNEGPDRAQPRARQNVVLEMGMLISAIGRPNVAILKKGHIEVPSDAQGILYLPFNNHVKEVVPRLADRLRAAGFILNPEAITYASS
ncbi:MAG: nucleotide-binding protein [Desulfobacterales bacterium]|nr:nucleotide-binding protein [Desulfobacterales bacterium]